MLAEAIMDHNEIKIIKFPKNKFKGNHWRLNIESIEEIKEPTKLKTINECVNIIENSIEQISNVDFDFLEVDEELDLEIDTYLANNEITEKEVFAI